MGGVRSTWNGSRPNPGVTETEVARGTSWRHPSASQTGADTQPVSTFAWLGGIPSALGLKPKRPRTLWPLPPRGYSGKPHRTGHAGRSIAHWWMRLKLMASLPLHVGLASSGSDGSPHCMGVPPQLAFNFARTSGTAPARSDDGLRRREVAA